jgi:type II secretory pathway pseudopilin PulG
MVTPKKSGGFTIIEVIVTATFVATVLIAISGVFIMVGKLNRQSRNLAIATALAEQKLEVYRNDAFSSIPVGSPAETFTASLPANFGSPKSAVVNVTTVSAGLEQVDIKIAYTEEGTPKNVQVTTLIAEQGLNK